ncbi:arabinogalactan endo-1,4-beta-galactosidase [Marinilabiliaceae bacterium JC017]|nr:arabinogalactan endo-1,4-beta-galactosidase [Marinilabiliaceae bacterium JC017]
MIYCMKKRLLILLIGIFVVVAACKKDDNKPDDNKSFIVGGDFSILRKMESAGGKYYWQGEENVGYEIFRANGYNYARFRLFNQPNMEGAVCNDLEYTIASAKQAKSFGFKILLDFHYSDTWADPAHQEKPCVWQTVTMPALADSVSAYTTYVLQRMNQAGVLPDMVQVGNEITNGMLWPEGKIYKDDGSEGWDSFITLLKAGIKAVKEMQERTIPVMVHIDQGANKEKTAYFFNHLVNQYHVKFDVIGLSYYPWWHGTLAELRDNLEFISQTYSQDIIIVETAYYANGFYPEPGESVLGYQPFPPTEQGQYDFLVALRKTVNGLEEVKGIFYWQPDGLNLPASDVHYLGRSLFSPEGEALTGISVFKEEI